MDDFECKWQHNSQIQGRIAGNFGEGYVNLVTRLSVDIGDNTKFGNLNS